MAVTLNASTTAGLVQTADTSGVLALQTAGTTAVTVDASQNVTLAGTLTTTGVTTFQAGTAALPAITTTGDTNTGIFFPAADTIAFSEGGTEAARFDSSGNFGVGVTPAVRLDVSGAASINGDARFVAKLADTSAVAQGNGGGVMFRGVYTGTTLVDAAGVQAYKANATDNNYSYGLAFSTRADGGNLTANMRLNESGNLGLGVTPNAWGSGPAMQIGNLGIATRTSLTSLAQFSANQYWDGAAHRYIATNFATLYTQNLGAHNWGIAASGTAGNAITFTNAMTLDTSGNLLVGTTDSGRTTGAGVKIGTPGGTTAGTISVVKTSSTGADDSYNLYSTGAAAYRFYVSLAGTVFATNTAIGAISDARLKENVRDLNVGLSEIMALKPRLYDWKEGKGADIKNARGFIAQEFEEVFPDLIDEWKDPAPEGEEPYKAVRQDLIPVLVKAIQEQQALITQLTARITALEGA